MDLSLSDLSDTDEGVHAEQQQTSHDSSAGIPARRGRGRPCGTFGGRIFREWSQEIAQQQQQQAAAAMPQAGSIEYARQVRSQKVQERRERKEVLTKAGLNPSAESSLLVLERFAPHQCMLSASSNELHLDLQDALLQSHKKKSKGVVDELEDKLTQHHLQGAMSTMSFNSFEKIAGDNNSGRKTLSVASALLEFAYLLWSAFCVFISVTATTTEKALKPVMCVVRLRYDETPTKVRISDHIHSQTEPDWAAIASMTSEQITEANVLGSETSSHYAKILQIELAIGMLVADVTRQRHIWTFGYVPTSLYALERTTGKNTFFALRDALESVPQLKDMTSRFPISVRHTCSDRYSANVATERHVSAIFPDSTLTHTFCDVHRLYSCIKASFAMAERDISGCLAFALGFGEPGTVAKMRQVLSKTILSRLEVLHEARPEGANARHQLEVFDAFLPIKDVSVT